MVLFASCGRDPHRAAGPQGDRPNVVLIVMDTTRADRCSLYGYEKPTTPTLSALAAEGVSFRNAWTPSPWTGPAHGSLFTGLRPEHHGFLCGRMRPYLRAMPTLAGWFREAGYATGCFSNNAFVSSEYGLEQGFDHVSRDFEDLRRPYPSAIATHRSALDWVRRTVDEDRNFFLFVNDIEPHAPYVPPEEFESAFMPPGISLEMRAHGRGLTHLALARHLIRTAPLAPSTIRVLSHLYDAEVATLDHEIGVLLGGLRRMGLLDHTIFVVAGDHGENFGEHGLVDHQGSLHRSVLHVPLVIRYLPRFAPGTVREEIVRLEDVPPTLLDLCGLEIPMGLDGESLLGPLGGRLARSAYLPVEFLLERLSADETAGRDMSIMNHEIRAAHDGRWHYILHGTGAQELYDLATDPRETRNLAASNLDEVRRLGALLPVLPGAAETPSALPPR
jgi:arylsulfatase A-like enzyme